MAKHKLKPEEMIKEIADMLIIYLKQGNTVKLDSYIKKLNLNINNFDQLLRIHFLLNKDVMSFIEELPHLIRNIKTSTQKNNREVNGEIRGRIDWQATIANRCKNNFNDKSRFVCQQVDKDFNIKENLVLKKFLKIIDEILINDLKRSWSDYHWLSNWFENDGLFNSFDQIINRNIYLKRINLDNVIVTDRMINDSKKSRNILYRKAAELLKLYYNYVENNIWQENEEKIIKLLNDSFIKPQKDSVLFELYWVMKLIETNTNKYSLELLDKKSNLTAEWSKGNYKYSLYHDSTGSDELNWKVKLSEVENSCNSYLKRKALSYKNAKKISSIFNSEITSSYWNGRPDIIIEIRNRSDNSLKKIIVAEVKYTRNNDTAKKGLKELLDYMYLIKDSNEKYLDLSQNEIEIEGLLLVDQIKNKDNIFKALKIKKSQDEINFEKSYNKKIIF
ncbi:hypothetical protein HSACCH_00833 [Halanaerobium saccharolyticum subsp. saccharolyticum DSM 6643]|uniref:Uncharacterized protein n=1 Tax=Halanaerobium saccharolyticum subsp. saccharolyticum DSM 6643 TaxID=1293054 RepID=M5DZW2_9FIRM|nr:hypothetical protein [Halanaerobium saccharolyticum]CCU78694.1 hypothetical protein HSACCH_00833 [Halanaerobium saccharolyticum subsp. saccharolyticum DSM 6643]